MDNLPQRTDTVYTNIEKLKDYEITNCIAYEMAIRNEENIANVEKFVRKLLSEDLVNNNYQLIHKQIGLNEYSYKLTENMINPFTLYLEKYPFFNELRKFIEKEKEKYITVSKERIKGHIQNHSEQNYNYKLSNAKSILKIYKNNLNNTIINEYKKFAKNNNIKKTLDSVYLYIDEKEIKKLKSYNHSKGFDELFYHKNIYKKTGKLSIDNKLTHTYLLETNFFTSYTRYIENKEINESEIKLAEITPIYSRPELYIPFEQNRKVKLNLNLSLPLKDLYDTIKILKKEFDNNQSITLSASEFSGNQLVSIDKDLVSILSHRNRVSDLFFIYDCSKLGISQNKISRLLYTYYESKDKNTKTTYDAKTVKKYRDIAVDYIDNKKYKELITKIKL